MARIQWQPLQLTPVNMGLLDSANQSVMGGIGTIGKALTNVGQQYKADNTNAALAQILGLGSLDDLNAQRSTLADSIAAQGQSIDQVKVLEALGAQQDALTRRQAAGVALEGGELGLQQTKQGIADQVVKNAALQDLLSGNVTGAQTALGQIQGDASPLFSAIRGEQRYADDKAYRTLQDAESKRRWEANFGLSQNADTRAQLSTGMTLANYLNPKAGETEAKAVYNTETGEWDYVQSSNPSRVDTLSSVLPLVTNQNAGGLSGVRGVRNNNPGNLDFVGQAGARREGGANGRFAQFDTPQAGMTALSKQLDRYYTGKTTGKPLQTVNDIISTWAPPNENNTAQYVAQVSKTLGVGPNDKLNFKDPNVKMQLMKAIVTKENGGNPYGDDIYSAAVTGKSTATAPKTYNIPKTVARQTAKATAATGIPFNAKEVATLKQGYVDAVKKLSGGESVPESPLAAKSNLDNWLVKNRSDKKNTNSITRLTGTTDADDLYSTAIKDPEFNKLSTTKKLKVLDTMMDYNKANQGLFWKNPSDIDKRLKSVILEDRKVTQQVQAAKRLELLDAAASKLMTGAGVQPGTIPNQSLYSLIDPQWAKKKGKGLGTVDNPFQ